MERKLASIQRIAALAPIEGADKIEVATILGWQVVVKKGEFKVGDLCVYFEIDSIVPERDEFEFLRERKFRVRTIKLRKQVSQGLAFPLPMLFKSSMIKVILNEGYDVTETLGVRKYDPQAEQEAALVRTATRRSKNRIDKWLMKYEWYRRLTIHPGKKPFPSFIAKTDETRVQNVPRIINELSGSFCIATEKLDGQSATYFLRRKKWFGYEFGVCSRNWQLVKKDNSSYWRIAEQYKIKEVLEKLLNNTSKDTSFVAIQGEIIGEGIQKNKYGIKGVDFYAFNLRWSNCVCSHNQMDDILCIKYDIKCVPLIKRYYRLPETIKELVEQAKGSSVIGSTIREGLVVRNHVHQVSFKVINPDFLLKHEDA